MTDIKLIMVSDQGAPMANIKNVRAKYSRGNCYMGEVVIEDPIVRKVDVSKTKMPAFLQPVARIFGWKKPETVTIHTIEVNLP